MMAKAINTKLAQVNIHHAKAASAVLARMFTQQHLGLALVQEPWNNNGIKEADKTLCSDMGASRPQSPWPTEPLL